MMLWQGGVSEDGYSSSGSSSSSSSRKRVLRTMTLVPVHGSWRALPRCKMYKYLVPSLPRQRPMMLDSSTKPALRIRHVACQFQDDGLLRPVLCTLDIPLGRAGVIFMSWFSLNDGQKIHHLQLFLPGLLRGQCMANESRGVGGD